MKNLLKECWQDNLLVLIWMLGAGTSTTIANFKHAGIINGIVTFNLEIFTTNLVHLIIAYSCFIFFTYLKLKQSEKTIQKMATSLRVTLLKRIAAVSYQEFHQQDTGTYSSWLTNDITQIEQLGFNPLYNLISSVINTTLAIFALFSLHWSLLLITSLQIFAILLIPKLFAKRVTEGATKVAQANENFLEKTTDFLLAYDTLLSLTAFPYLITKLKATSAYLSRTKFQQAKLMAKVAVSGGIGNVIGQVSILSLAGYLALLQQLSIGSISAAGSFAAEIFNTTGNLSQVLASIKSTQPFFKKYATLTNQVTTESPDFQLTEGFKLENVSFKLPHTQIISNINFNFDLTKKYAIIGASGSGKSTLMNILSGRINNYSGSITLGNYDLKTLTLSQLSQEIFYLNQSPHLFNESIRDNLTLGDCYDDSELWQVLKQVGLAEMIKELPEQLSSFAGEQGRLLSGGEAQRLALARGLLRQKKILLLDEATSKLDSKNALKIEHLLLDRPELTVIMVTHHLHTGLTHKLDQTLTLSD